MRKKICRNNRTAIRLCLCTGPWHLISLRASLLTREKQQGNNTPVHEDYLVVYGLDWQKQLREDLLKIAKASQYWKEVINIDDLLNITHPDQFSNLKRALGSLDLPYEATELWIPGFLSHMPRVAAELWKTANIYLYEEGLSTYSTFSVASYSKYLVRQIKKQAKKILRRKERLSKLLRRMRSDLDRRNVILIGGAVKEHIKRTRGSYILLDGYLPLSPSYPCSIKIFPVDRDILHHVIDAYVKHAGIPEITEKNGKPKALFLGQILSRHSGIDSDDELDIFRSSVQSIIDAGYQVVWKDHPRAVPPLFDKIKQIAPDDIRILPDIQHCPIETILPKLGISFCVGLWSSTLFYAKSIYGMESYTVVNKYKDLIHGNNDLLEWISLTANHISDLHEKLNPVDTTGGTDHAQS